MAVVYYLLVNAGSCRGKAHRATWPGQPEKTFRQDALNPTYPGPRDDVYAACGAPIMDNPGVELHDDDCGWDLCRKCFKEN